MAEWGLPPVFLGRFPFMGASSARTSWALPEGPGRTMVQKLVESVALATSLCSQLIFMIGQLAQSKQVAAKALRPACGLAILNAV